MMMCKGNGVVGWMMLCNSLSFFDVLMMFLVE